MANIEIGGRLHSTATGNVVTGANEVLDDTKNKKQSVINAEVDETIGDDNTAGTIKGRIKTAEGKLDTLNGDSSTSGSVAKSVDDAKTELIGGATSDGNTLKKVEDRTATLETAVGSNGSVDQRIAAAKSEVIGDAASDYNTLGKLEDKIQAEATRATTRENQIYDLVHTPEQHYVTVATYAELANIASPSDDTVYRVSSYNGKTSQVDNTVYSEYGYDGTNFVFLCVKSQIDEVYDISAHHSNNTYVDLAAALDGGNNIPQELRRGGMSVKFVQSSDNKYIQCRLMADSFTTDTTQWAIAEEGVYVENPEFVYVKTDKEGKILWAIKIDGGIYYGAGVPQQVKDYIEEKISSLSLDEYEDIVTFLSDYLGSDTTLKAMIDEINAQIATKLNSEGLDPDALGTVQAVENQEYIQVTTDSEDKILEGITSEGVKQINLPIDTPSAAVEHGENPEFVYVKTDKEGKILEGRKVNGNKVEYCNVEYPNGIPSEIKKYVDDNIEETENHIDDVNNRIDEIVQDKDNIKLPQLPDYYFENSYLDNKVKLINEKIRECSNNGDVFFWITDVHWESDRNARYSPSLISYIRQRTNIPRLFNGGDNFDGIEGRVGSPDRTAGFDGNIDFTNRLRKALGSDKVYTAIGNHEVINYNTYPEIFYALRQHNDDVVYGDNNKSYFYVDNNQQKIRYVVLTAFGVQEEGITPPFRNEFKENPEQLDWLMGAALNLSSDWTVVIFLHGLFMIGTRSTGSHYSPKLSSLNSRKVAWAEPWEYENVWIDSIENHANNKIGKVIDHDPRPLDGQGNIDLSLAETVTSVPAIADKFMLYSPNNDNNYNRYVARIQWYGAGQVWKLVWTSYGSYISETSLNIEDEVIIWKAFGGKIAGVIQGHTHADRLHLEAGIPFIISACDKWNEAGGDDLTVTRTKGTITEQHFEVVVLNKTLQKWTFISIGAPASGGYDDNVGEDVQVREISYQ